MKLDELYYKVKASIDKIDFNLLWEGFYPLKFALYNHDECFFNGKYIEKTDAFIGNTSIKYNGEMIAIWHVMEDIDPVILCSKMIHEMFHGFQNIHGESRFPDEIHAIYNYNINDENLSIKLEESKCIHLLIDKFDLEKFNKLLGLRKYRELKFPYEYLYETKIEQIEGTANYIELSVLKQLNKNLYMNKINEMRNRILNPKIFLPIRIISYDVGALLLHVLTANNIKINKDFNKDYFLFENVKNANAYNIFSKESFVEVISDYHLMTKKIIDKSILLNNIISNKEHKILAFNVYNARYLDNYIVTEHFLMYEDNDLPVIKYGNFVLKTDAYGIANRIYQL